MTVQIKSRKLAFGLYATCLRKFSFAKLLTFKETFYICIHECFDMIYRKKRYKEWN